MNRLQLRTAIVDRTGRLDLVGVTGAGLPDYATDNGIDSFIQDARCFLYARYQKLLAWQTKTAAVIAGQYEVVVADLRLAEQVRGLKADGTWLQLAQRTHQYLIDNYEVPFASADVGDPIDFEMTTRTTFTAPATWTPETVLTILPPSQDPITLYIYGSFYPTAFANNAETDWISTTWPEAVILCAAWKIGTARKNAEDAAQWYNQLLLVLRDLDKDEAVREGRSFEGLEGGLQIREWEE